MPGMSAPSKITDVARELVARGRGILAADESTPTIRKRFEAIGVESTEQRRRDYRELLFGAAGLGEFISGAILYDETIRQKAADGSPLVEVLRRNGILTGIKVDGGAKPLAHFPGEKITEGLDGLRARLAEYRELGARFTKWRAVLAIGEDGPTRTGMRSNAHALARFAALSQEAELVPIVEPEVLADGAHSIERCEAVTGDALRAVFAALAEHRVVLEAMLLKPNMIVSGRSGAAQVAPEKVAEATRRCLRRFVPAAVPGIVFLSGGQSETEATQNLAAINRRGTDAPWELSFSFGRALQASALAAWGGRVENVAAARAILLHRARCNRAARMGEYSAELERAAGAVSVAGRTD